MTQDPAAHREKLQRFVQEHGARSRDEFLKLWTVPLLVQVTEPASEQEKAAPRFGTMAMSKEDLVYADSGKFVFPLRKSATNAFAMMVTVGRAANNDIVLPYDAISKFHAYFTSTPTGWQLVDAKSTNGTFVGERRLAADGKEPLDLKSVPVIDISFSKVVQCRLYSPPAFHDMVRELVAATHPRK